MLLKFDTNNRNKTYMINKQRRVIKNNLDIYTHIESKWMNADCVCYLNHSIEPQGFLHSAIACPLFKTAPFSDKITCTWYSWLQYYSQIFRVLCKHLYKLKNKLN